MVKVVACKAAWTVGGAAFTRANAAAGTEHFIVDAEAIKASLTVVGGGAACAQWAVARGRYRLAKSAVTHQAAIALAAVGTSTAASAYTYKSRSAIAVAGALWGNRCFTHAAIANFAISAF